VLKNTPVKDALRAHLALRCAEEELCSWYDPLCIEMNQEERCLTVTFPHHLFGSWFEKTGQEALEFSLTFCFGNGIPVHYVSPRQQKRPPEPLYPLIVRSMQKKKPFGENFTLENFICNKKNFFPLAIAHEITKSQEDTRYNPLVYYGKSGSGKTHLLRAIANEFSGIRDYHSIFYGTTAKLFQEWENHGTDLDINRKYRVYCIDDIHLFTNNFPLQEKFIIFLDACLHEKKQFVCACAEPLAFYKGFSESLRSRLELGLIVELKKPDIDVRMRFIQHQCVLHNITIAREHMLLLAQRCKHLCYLSGVLLKVAAYKKLAQQDIIKQDIEKILRYSGEYSPLTPHDIIHLVAEYFSLPSDELTGNKRKPALVFARQIAMYLCREILGTSYPALGQIFGGKDHSTIIYGIKKIEKYIVINNNTYTEITELKNMCLQKNDENHRNQFFGNPT